MCHYNMMKGTLGSNMGSSSLCLIIDDKFPTTGRGASSVASIFSKSLLLQASLAREGIDVKFRFGGYKPPAF